MGINNPTITSSDIHKRIYTFRNLQVMLDCDLAKHYQRETNRINIAVSNISFLKFMFQLDSKEYELLRTQSETSEGQSNLRFQFGTSNWGGRRTYPFVFSEQGVAMLSAVLKSEIAVKVIVTEFHESHDRFLLLDEIELYHFGASLKDLGRKWFAFSKMDVRTIDILEKLKKL
jgi:hypothetical protein